MNIAIYGKTMENFRNRIDVKVIKTIYYYFIKKTIYNVHQNQAKCRTKYLTIIQS